MFKCAGFVFLFLFYHVFFKAKWSANPLVYDHNGYRPSSDWWKRTVQWEGKIPYQILYVNWELNSIPLLMKNSSVA